MRHKIVIDARMINVSGIGRYTKVILSSLQNEGSEIHVLCKKNTLNSINLFSFKTIIFNYPIYSLREQFAFFFKVPKCDLFISPHYNIPIFLPQTKKILTFIPDVNHLVFSHDFSIEKKLYAKILFSQVIVKSNLIITISEFSKSEIIRVTKCRPDKLIVAKLSIDKEYFKNIDEEPCTFIENCIFPFFLFVGNIKPHKNLKRVILAFSEFLKENSGYKFIIVGKVENLINADIELFHIIDKSEILKKAVIFTGNISDNQLVYLYKKALALIFVSLYEGFGLPPLEAMLFECPVIASREGSLPEICGDAVLYVDAYNVASISEGMNQLAKNLKLKNELIMKGKKKVSEYDWSTFSSTVKKTVKSLLEK